MMALGLISTLLSFGPVLPVKIESRRYPQAVGTYTAGSLVAPDQFREDALTSVKLFPERDRIFGALEMVTLLESTARALHALYPHAERLQVGDIAERTGGDLDGHGSHENGLDVDLAYLREDSRELDPRSATEFPDEYVTAGQLSRDFSLEKNLALLQLIVSSKIINRIFVDPVIKSRLCDYADSFRKDERARLTETLRRLRPWPLHGDHFHVRIQCPRASRGCISQAPVAPGDGCAEVRSTVRSSALDF